MIEGILMKKQNIDKPYEKFMTFGPSYLTDAELLAIIIRTGTKGEDALSLAEKILHLNNNRDGLLGLHHTSVEQLKSVHGIGEVKAVRIKCITELSNRIASARMTDRLSFQNPELVAAYYMEQMRHLEYEKILCILLDNKARFIKDIVISTGTVNRSIMSAREIFIKALEHHAVYIMLLHNHPSGDSTPSEDDILTTQKIKAAGALLQIPLLDHLIIGDGTYVSMAGLDLL